MTSIRALESFPSVHRRCILVLFSIDNDLLLNHVCNLTLSPFICSPATTRTLPRYALSTFQTYFNDEWIDLGWNGYFFGKWELPATGTCRICPHVFGTGFRIYAAIIIPCYHDELVGPVLIPRWPESTSRGILNRIFSPFPLSNTLQAGEVLARKGSRRKL